MNKKRLKFLFTRETIVRFISHFLISIGTIWLVIELTSFFFPDSPLKRTSTFFIAIIASSIYALIRSFPKTKYSRSSKTLNIEIEIKVGDIFNEKDCDIAIGSSDCLDTDIPDIINGNSLKGQLIKRCFSGNQQIIDNAISTSLSEQQIQGNRDTLKTFGKNIRYPIGTVANIPLDGKSILLTIFSKISPNKYTIASQDDLWLSLSGLWQSKRHIVSMNPIAIPVWGAGFARASASRLSLIQLILTSFVMASREMRFTNKLIIVVSENDYDPDEMDKMSKLLETMIF